MIRRGEIRVHKESGLHVRVIRVQPDGWVDVEYPDARSRRTGWLTPRSGYWAADLYEFFPVFSSGSNSDG